MIQTCKNIITTLTKNTHITVPRTMTIILLLGTMGVGNSCGSSTIDLPAYARSIIWTTMCPTTDLFAENFLADPTQHVQEQNDSASPLYKTYCFKCGYDAWRTELDGNVGVLLSADSPLLAYTTGVLIRQTGVEDSTSIPPWLPTWAVTIPKWGTIPDDVKAIDFGTAGIWLHSLAVTVNEDGPRAWVAGWFARREQYIIQLRNTWRPMDIYWDASKTDIIQQFPILEDPEAMGIHGGQDITTSDQIKYIITTFKDLEVAWSRDTEVLSPPVGEEIYNEEDGLGQDSLYALRKEYDRCRWAWRVLLDERGNPQKTEDEVLSDEDTGDQITIPSAPVYDDTREFNPPAILDGRVWEQGLRSVWDENAGELDCWEQEGDGQDMQPPQLNDENLAQLFTYYKNLSGSGNGSAAGTDFTKLTDTWQSLRARDLIPDIAGDTLSPSALAALAGYCENLKSHLAEATKLTDTWQSLRARDLIPDIAGDTLSPSALAALAGYCENLKSQLAEANKTLSVIREKSRIWETRFKICAVGAGIIFGGGMLLP